MKCGCGPQSDAEKPKFEARREKNQDNGEIIETERPDEADRRATLSRVTGQPGGDTQGEQSDSTDAAKNKAGRNGQMLPYQNGNGHRRKCDQCETGQQFQNSFGNKQNPRGSPFLRLAEVERYTEHT